MDWRERRTKTSKQSVLDDARRLREERNRLRSQQVSATVIEAWTRGFLCRLRERRLALEAAKKKVADLLKIRNFLGDKLSVPATTIAQLVRELCYCGTADVESIEGACSFVTTLEPPLLYARFTRICWLFDSSKACLDFVRRAADTPEVLARTKTLFDDVDGEAPLDRIRIALAHSEKAKLALWEFPYVETPKILADYPSPSTSPFALANRISLYSSAESIATHAAACEQLKKWLSDDDVVVLRWEQKRGARVPVLAPEVVRAKLLRLVEPRLLSRIVDDLLPVATVTPEPPNDDDLRATAKLAAAKTTVQAKKTKKSASSTLTDLLGAKWARSLNAALSSLSGGSSSNSSKAASSSKKAAANPQQQQQQQQRENPTDAGNMALLCRMLYNTLPAAGPRRRFEALNCLAFHPRVARCLYEAFNSKKKFDKCVVYSLCVVVRHALVVVDDDELEQTNSPLAPFELRRLVIALKQPLFDACSIYGEDPSPESTAIAGLLCDLKGRRKAVAAAEDWHVDAADDRYTLEELRRQTPRAEKLCLLMPQAIPFRERAKLFFERCGSGRNSRPERNTSWFGPSETPVEDKTVVRVRRSRAFEDGLAQLGRLPAEKWRGRVVVHFVDELTGKVESGIDGGGLFKEFLVDVCNMAFSLGLFKQHDGLLYPNPNSSLAAGPNHLALFEFVGALIGKALRENVTVQPRFNRSFLRFLSRQNFNFLGLLEELDDIDPDLYKNLKFLRLYSGDVGDLCLTFSVSTDELGKTTEVDLIPNGRNVSVTDANKHSYVQLVAKHHLVDRLKLQSQAFVRGLGKCIDLHLLTLFDEPELQHLISGPDDDLDIEDLIKYTKYEGFLPGPLDSRLINRFWTVVKAFSPEDQALLLKFATSCERPPPLGFANLHPPFTIRKVGNATDRLPTSSTCFNTLKLPVYPSATILKTKLLASIRAQAGFDLS